MKMEGRMTLGIESRISDVLNGIRELEKEAESWCEEAFEGDI